MDRTMNDIALEICRVGCRGDEIEKFLDAMETQHRTHQQSFMRLAVAFIKRNAVKDGNGYYDLRNQATVEACHEIVEQVDSRFLAIPMI
jgi:hypothetical protein